MGRTTEREKFRAAHLSGPYTRASLRESDYNLEVKRESAATAPPTAATPNMAKSGLLAEETNMRNGTLLKHTVPLEARAPTDEWVIISFAADGAEKTCRLMSGGRPCFVIGTDERVSDLPLAEPTMSRQHAVICFRQKAAPGAPVCPYLMDLDSLNGTRLNGDRIESRRYYELLHKDLILFADGFWEHVVLKAPPLASDRAPLLAEDLLDQAPDGALGDAPDDAPGDAADDAPTVAPTVAPQSALLRALAPSTADTDFDTAT